MPGSGAAGPVVLVSFAGRRWRLPRGGVLTVGRSRSCDIQLPDDDHVSRRAAELSVLPDCVLVKNMSTTKALYLRPPAGEDRVVEPGAATTSLPYATFGVVFPGQVPRVYTVGVDASAIRPASSASGPATRSPSTVTNPLNFTDGQMRVLIELCRPMLTQSGPQARPATYEEIGAALNLTPLHVRNVIKRVRESLAPYAMADLPDTGPTSNTDLRLPLARWLIRNQVIGHSHLGRPPGNGDATGYHTLPR